MDEVHRRQGDGKNRIVFLGKTAKSIGSFFTFFTGHVSLLNYYPDDIFNIRVFNNRKQLFLPVYIFPVFFVRNFEGLQPNG
jgi:hypothetical protein